MKPSQAAPATPSLEPPTLERVRALARAIGESAAFRAFEAAQDALQADADLSAKLSAAQAREEQIQLVRAWGGADAEEESALDRQWEELANQPTLIAHLDAREKLLGLLREVAAAITEAVGLDFGATCSPAGGCC